MRFKSLATVAIFALWGVSQTLASEVMMEDFKLQPETRWRFFTDTVMGGASSGQMDSVRQDGVISGVGPGRHDQAALGVI